MFLTIVLVSVFGQTCGSYSARELFFLQSQGLVPKTPLQIADHAASSAESAKVDLAQLLNRIETPLARPSRSSNRTHSLRGHRESRKREEEELDDEFEEEGEDEFEEEEISYPRSVHQSDRRKSSEKDREEPVHGESHDAELDTSLHSIASKLSKLEKMVRHQSRELAEMQDAADSADDEAVHRDEIDELKKLVSQVARGVNDAEETMKLQIDTLTDRVMALTGAIPGGTYQAGLPTGTSLFGYASVPAVAR